MSAAFYVSRDGEGVTLQCSVCKTVYRMEDLEAGQRVNVVVTRGIGEETFEAVATGTGLLLPRAALVETLDHTCGNLTCGHHDFFQQFNCKAHPKPSTEVCKNFSTPAN
jgi:pyruvoyl-dependent arginine decarboxylase (PvlArgDC)